MKVCKNLLKAAMIRARHAVVVFEAFVTDVDDCQTPMNTPPVDGDEDEIKTEDIYLRTFRPPFDIAKVKTILRKFAVEKSVEEMAADFSGKGSPSAENFGVHVNDFVVEPNAIVQA